MGLPQKGVSVIPTVIVGRGKPIPRHIAMMLYTVGRGKPIPRHACLPYPSIPKPIGPGAIVFNPPPVKPPFKFNDARRRPEAAVQIFGRLLIARDKRVRQIRNPTKNPDEGEFPSIFRGKECFCLWHTSPKEGGDEEETNQFFRTFVWVKQTRFHCLAYLANRHRSFLQQKTKMSQKYDFFVFNLDKKGAFRVFYPEVLLLYCLAVVSLHLCSKRYARRQYKKFGA